MGLLPGLQRTLGNRSLTHAMARHETYGRLQRMKIGTLGVNTLSQNKTEVLEKLGKKWSKFTGFGPITQQEAAELLRFFAAGSPRLPVEFTEDLEERARGDSSGSEGSESPRSSEGETDSSGGEEMFKPALELFARPGHSERASPDKRAIAVKFVDAMRQLGLDIFLAGGAAVTLSGGGRPINDLDFRIEIDRDVTFARGNREGEQLIEAINGQVELVFRDVDRFVVSDEHSGHTIKSKLDGCEVSITRTPRVAYLAHGQAAPHSGAGAAHSIPGREIPSLGGFDLILDKAYSLVMRRESDRGKAITDLIDLLSVMTRLRGGFGAGCLVLRFLDLQRGAAYSQQAAKVNQRAQEQLFGPSLIAELHAMVDDLIKQSSSKFGPEQLALAKRLVDELETIMKSSASLKVL